jgi:hypothetical protein
MIRIGFEGQAGVLREGADAGAQRRGAEQGASRCSGRCSARVAAGWGVSSSEGLLEVRR